MNFVSVLLGEDQLQEEVLKKLTSIVEQLDKTPAHGEQIENEPG